MVDVNDAGLMTADAVRRAITGRTRAIVPVHYAGQACDMEELMLLAADHGIPLVEDAAHAAGCVYRGSRIGTHSSSVVFSFYATKNMTTGEGGMITTNDDALADRMRVLTLHGMSRDAWSRYTQTGSWYYEVIDAGYKFNMTDIQAALGIHQLRRLDGFIARRREIAAMYDAAFAGVPELRIPGQLPDRNHVYHLYPLRVTRLPELNRDTIIEDLRTALIGTSVHFIPLHRHPFYRDHYNCKPEQFPQAEKLYTEIVSLPLYPRMTDDDVITVIDAVTESVTQLETGVLRWPACNTGNSGPP
jgi:dTDP-4-amino-4,6-dideoxygalactose transaminase